MSRRKTTEEFIQEARKVHGDKYDYSKVEYKDARTNVTIICPEHGEFPQLPTHHLKGCGCKKCKEDRLSLIFRKTAEKFIEDARKVHGDKYDYSKVEYINANTPVTIICPEHGKFPQTPRNHLAGHGCPVCSNSYMDTEKFIEDARKVHGDKYDYSKVEYINAKTPVTIICPEHGEFERTPDNHLHGSHGLGLGCPNCCSKRYRLEENIKNILTINNITFEFHKAFDWLKRTNNLFLDFYLPDHKIAIECQGLQHFRAIEFFGGEGQFEYRVQNDKIKRDLCNQHGIQVFYYSDLGIDYPYEVFEDLDEILNKIKEYERSN